MIHKELERAKCICADEGFEVDSLDEYSFRARKADIYIFNVWVGYKKGRFKGYTVLVWGSKQYYKGVQDFEQFVLKYKKSLI